MNWMKPNNFLFAGAAIVSLSSANAASIVHNFSGGEGTANPDQFAGTAGNGWTTAFRGATDNASINVAVVNTSPLAPGAGNYLSRQITGTGTGSKRSTISRNYGDNGTFDADSSHTITFLWRADDMGTFTTTTDYFTLFGRDGATSGDTNGDVTWFLRLPGANDGDAIGGNFNVYNGNRGSNTNFDTGLFEDTGVTVVAGTTYSFTVVSDPSTADWSVGIQEVGGSASFQSGTLGWRRGSGATLDHQIGFGSRVSADAESSTFSVDEIMIVPEPSAALLGLLGALTLLRRKR